VLVGDYSTSGLRAAKKIYELAKSLKIKIGSAWLVINKASGSLAAISKEIDNAGLAVAGVVGYEEAIVEWSLSGESVFGLVSKTVKDNIAKIADKLIKG